GPRLPFPVDLERALDRRIDGPGQTALGRESVVALVYPAARIAGDAHHLGEAAGTGGAGRCCFVAGGLPGGRARRQAGNDEDGTHQRWPHARSLLSRMSGDARQVSPLASSTAICVVDALLSFSSPSRAPMSYSMTRRYSHSTMRASTSSTCPKYAGRA